MFLVDHGHGLICQRLRNSLSTITLDGIVWDTVVVLAGAFENGVLAFFIIFSLASDAVI